MAIDFYDDRCFKTWNYGFLHDEVEEVVVESLALLIGDYEAYRKHAALLLLKALIRDGLLKSILEDSCVYPFDRNDKKVALWKKTILSRGKCEFCESEDNLEAHHIVRWSDFPQGRADIKNGLCLCHDCHTEMHRFDKEYHMMKAKKRRMKYG